MKHSRMLVFTALLLAGGLASAQAIRVASKDFTEGLITGSFIVLALEEAGFEVEDRLNLGSTNINREALLAGEIDVYPEYTGTAINNFFRQEDVDIPEGISGDAEASYALVRELDAEINNLRWLGRSPANNTFALAVTRQFAEEQGVTTSAELAAYINDGGEVRIAVSDEFAQRPDGLQAFARIYGFELSADQILELAGASTQQTSQALATGQNNVNVAMVYGTDGALQAYDFVVLDDPDGAQPVFQPAPVFRAEIIDANPEIAEILDPIFEMLDNETLQELNARVEVDGENPREVAQDFLQSEGFID